MSSTRPMPAADARVTLEMSGASYAVILEALEDEARRDAAHQLERSLTAVGTGRTVKVIGHDHNTLATHEHVKTWTIEIHDGIPVLDIIALDNSKLGAYVSWAYITVLAVPPGKESTDDDGSRT